MQVKYFLFQWCFLMVKKIFMFRALMETTNLNIVGSQWVIFLLEPLQESLSRFVQ